jgi:predicted Zn-dependent protease
MRSLKLASLLALSLLISACGVNPLTGESELQFISTAQEIKIGQQNYLPARQTQGGDYIVDPRLTLYVRGVGEKLAAASDRDLPYEFVVLNSSVPNAWAMPGGKIAINRGLLLELGSEAELAAVMGHEIVHAVGRHGAKAQERGMLLQGGMLATQIATGNSRYAGLIGAGAGIGAQLISTKYGRDAELQSDSYGMLYMKRAGYDPRAAVALQETFVRLSEGRNQGGLQTLFASHPPSAERVAKNRATVEQLGAGGVMGVERYKKAIAQIRKDKPAYDAYDKALQAAKKKDFKTANSLADKALKLQPREALFYGLKGDLALNTKSYKTASNYYAKAINRYPEFFAFHLHDGYARQGLGDKSGAKRAFERANSILPTPDAHKALGDLAFTSGRQQAAFSHYQSAARSNSPAGQAALASLVRMDLPQNPARYIKTRLSMSGDGQVVVTVYNKSPVAVHSVQLSSAYFDANGRQLSRAQALRVPGVIPAGKATQISLGRIQGQGLHVQVERAALRN